MSIKGRALIKMMSVIFAAVACAVLFSFGTAAATQHITMQYDDYFSDFEYSEVTVLDKGTATSFKVGYGVPSGTPDDSVVKIIDGVLHASGIGTARVMIDATEYDVTVEPAPISMFLLIGQSNMYGFEGDEAQSVANKNGTVYSTFGVSNILTEENAAQFVPSALSGESSMINMQGNTQNLEDNPVNRLTVAGDGKMGLDSGFAYKWHEMTGDKVWLVNAAHGGTKITKWKKGGEEYNQAVAVFKYAQQVMKNEIAAGHYVLKNYGSLWCQGCSDRAHSAQYYLENFLSMYNGLKTDLLFDVDADGVKDTLGLFDIIMPRAGKDDCFGYRSGIYDDTTNKEYERTFKDLEMRGHRVAQYWLVNNPSYRDINLVCNIGDSWVYMPDGSHGVKDYFMSNYPEGRVDYPIQVQQDDSWYYPDTPEDVHDNIHYNQIGYNEIGFEAAENAAYTHGRAEKPEKETTVTFYDWTGYRQVESVEPTVWKDSHSLIVPVVNPVYESKNVTYNTSDNLKYDLYDLTAEYGSTGGELVAVGDDFEKKVTVDGDAAYNIGENYYYYKGTPKGLVQFKDGNYPENRVVIVGSTDGTGTAESFVHRGVIYRFDRTVNLLDNHEWVVEWSGRTADGNTLDLSQILLSENVYLKHSLSGDVNYLWQRYIDSTGKAYATVGRVKMGTSSYDQHSVAVDKLVRSVKVNRTYRIFNRVEADGSNSIHFSVDGIYCGQFSGVSSRDFAFRFIGARGFEIDNYIFNYLKIYENSHAALTGHTVVKNNVPQSCTSVGITELSCENCEYSQKEIMPLSEHNYVLKTQKATCLEDGYSKYECSCGRYTKYTVLPKTGHSFSSLESDNNATYLTDGTKTAKCRNCGETKTVADKGSKLVLKSPSSVTAKPGNTSVVLTWTKSKDAVGYRVYIKLGSSWKALKTTTSTTYKVTALSHATVYTFAVKAYTKENSKTVWAPKYTSVSAMTKLAKPAIRLASTAEGRVTVAWSDISGETGYQLWYSTSKNGTYKKVANYSADTTKIYKTGFSSSRVYYFKLRAYTKTADGYVYGSFSDIKSVRIK